jgi:hypothetical protein
MLYNNYKIKTYKIFDNFLFFQKMTMIIEGLTTASHILLTIINKINFLIILLLYSFYWSNSKFSFFFGFCCLFYCPSDFKLYHYTIYFFIFNFLCILFFSSLLYRWSILYIFIFHNNIISSDLIHWLRFK